MMVQGTSGLVPNSGDVASSAEAHKSGGGGFSEDEKLRISEEGERNSGGNRWPRQETMALLKIRSDMDVVFRDSGLKGPLWEEVSRKLAELGYHRSAKKCKEKFENVYKYHKRTKDGRTTKADGKTYRFFDQLEALDTHPSFQLPPPVIPQPLTSAPPATVMAMSVSSNTIPIVPQLTIPSAANPNKNPTNISSHEQPQPQPQPQSHPQQQPQPQPQPQPMIVKSSSIPTQSSSPPFYQSKMSTSFVSNSNSSSSTSSDEEPERSRKRKRVWKDFFGRLMKEVIEKQEELQKNFLEALEKRERDRMTREEAWRVQEMAKMNREHEILVQERSMSAAKDAAVIAFLQKVTEQQTQQNLNVTSQIVQVQDTQLQPPPPQPPASSPQPQPQLQLQPQTQPQQHQPLSPPPPPQPQPQQQPQAPLSLTPPQPQPQSQVSQPQIKDNNGSENFMPPSPSRWPKAEIEALIRLRTTLDTKYQENAPKGPLWEEISAAMRNLGYNRNAKRCKEKWENINKYYKKVKESNKKRPEDAKTCPYFHQLEAIYKEKAKTSMNHGNGGASGDSFNPGFAMKTENPMGPIMVQPEQQWPHDQNDEEEDTGDDDEEDDDGADGFEIVTNKASSMATDE